MYCNLYITNPMSDDCSYSNESARMSSGNATLFFFLTVISFFFQGVYVLGIGINYGQMADNLRPPSQVAQFLMQNTIIEAVKLYDADPDVLRAFANTNITVSVTIPNEIISQLSDLSFAQHWVRINIVRYIPATKIVRVLVGNEVLTTANSSLVAILVPAMQNLHTALVSFSLHDHIKVTSSHSLGILSTSSPPSTGKFHHGYDTNVLKPLLSFLKATGSPFMINAYPYFGFTDDTLNYALFRTTDSPTVIDPYTGMHYTNMFSAQIDAVFSAMKRLGFSDVEIIVAETGWPSKGDAWQTAATLQNGKDYNQHLLLYSTSGAGTPLMPNRTVEIYIFSLFNENLKPGPTSERNFGLFHADLTPVYGDQVGILLQTPTTNTDATTTGDGGGSGTALERRWCLPKSNVDANSLQINIDFVCGQDVDCSPIKSGGSCFLPDTVEGHAAYAMNKYYHVTGMNAFDCDFGQTGLITTVDPSYGSCKYD